MVAKINRLTARGVANISAPGRHADGGNLYLNVTKTGAKSWVFFYRHDGRMREMGLGNIINVPLAAARDRAAENRRILKTGSDPLTVRAAAVVAAKPTFGEFSEQHIASIEAGWRNMKHRAQWRSTLDTHAKTLKNIAVDQVATADVLALLAPIWTTKPETASRVRGRIAAVLDAAKAQGHRSGDNPAAWTGHLKNLLPARSKLSRGHHQALRIDALSDFMQTLGSVEGVSARALEFTILTAARSGEARGCRWSEIDFSRKIWIVPKDRMKAGVEHRVPLGEQTCEILGKMAETRIGDLVFPGAKFGRPLSDMSLLMVLRRLNVGATVHGFRSTFRDWASEEMSFPHEVCEMALAHTIENNAEAAYRRGDLLEKRRLLMDAWDLRCRSFGSGNVVTIAQTRRG